jgi:hypothetical protein
VHELSLCSAIADTVRDNTDGRRVERVNLRIGYLRQVVPETLEFCWGFITEVLRPASIRGALPDDLHLIGVQPEDLTIGIELSPRI